MQTSATQVKFLNTDDASLKLGTGVTTNSLHPGVVKTDLWRHLFDENSMWRRFLRFISSPIMAMSFKTVEHGAQTSIFCAIAPELANVSGKYFR